MNINAAHSYTDQELVELVLKGNQNIFSQVIRNTETLVSQIIYRMVPNAEDRKDIAQDVYLKAYHNLGGFRYQSRLSTWIAQIAYNTCYSFLERKKFLLVELTDEHFPPGLETDTRLDAKINAAILQREVDRLPPVYKTLITLFHSEEISYAEIAEITTLPEGTVKSYLSRARKTLRNNLLKTYSREAL